MVDGLRNGQQKNLNLRTSEQIHYSLNSLYSDQTEKLVSKKYAVGSLNIANKVKLNYDYDDKDNILNFNKVCTELQYLQEHSTQVVKNLKADQTYQITQILTTIRSI